MITIDFTENYSAAIQMANEHCALEFGWERPKEEGVDDWARHEDGAEVIYTPIRQKRKPGQKAIREIEWRERFHWKRPDGWYRMPCFSKTKGNIEAEVRERMTGREMLHYLMIQWEESCEDSYLRREQDPYEDENYAEKYQQFIFWLLSRSTALDWCLAYLRFVRNENGNNKYKIIVEAE